MAGISLFIDQAIPVGDIDRDGIADLAVIGLNQTPATQASSQDSSVSNEGLRLFIDFLSGFSGTRIGYREEFVTASVKITGVAEIDYVELAGHELICSVVYGSREELTLSSTTFTFDLLQSNPATVARGLTVSGIGFQRGIGFQPVNSSSRTTWDRLPACRFFRTP